MHNSFGCNSPFHGLCFSFALQCYPTWMQGNFGLKLQNSPKLPPYMLDFIVIQMSRVNCEKGYWQGTKKTLKEQTLSSLSINVTHRSNKMQTELAVCAESCYRLKPRYLSYRGSSREVVVSRDCELTFPWYCTI